MRFRHMAGERTEIFRSEQRKYMDPKITFRLPMRWHSKREQWTSALEGQYAEVMGNIFL
jgi:hypothetical protein